MKTNIKEVNEHINKLNNEVARLREENANLKGTIRAIIENRRLQAKAFSQSADDFEEMLNGLAPAPEEPVTEKDIKVSDKEPAPAWRELGPDEVICEGDEIQWPYKDWQIAKSSIGYKVGYWDGLVKGRTRRPLPKAQEDMPLEKELKIIGNMTNVYREESGAIVSCLRYLRDEIQKLKGK